MGGDVGDDSGMYFLFLNGIYVVTSRWSRLDGAVLMMGHSVFWRGVVEDCP